MRYDILLFDADNTVLDFDMSEKQALKRAFEESGLVFSDQLLQVYRKNNIFQWQLYELGKIEKKEILINRFVETFDELGLIGDVERVSELYEEYLHDGFFIVDHAKEVLEQLQSKCRLYIVSNGVKSIQDSRMKGSEMDKYFMRRFVSEEVGFPKPQIAFFNYCFSQIENFTNEQTLIIGDSLTSDIQGGINAGIDTCWFNPTHLINKSNIYPTYEIDDLRSLFEIVQ